MVCWLAKILSCISQNLPCAPAAMAASAAGSALGWKGSGWFFHTMRILPLYSSSSCLRVGPTLEQKGHWKSENSITVIGAFFGPLLGESPTAIWTGLSGGGGAVGAAAVGGTPEGGAAAAPVSR